MKATLGAISAILLTCTVLPTTPAFGDITISGRVLCGGYGVPNVVIQVAIREIPNGSCPEFGAWTYCVETDSNGQYSFTYHDTFGDYARRWCLAVIYGNGSCENTSAQWCSNGSLCGNGWLQFDSNTTNPATYANRNIILGQSGPCDPGGGNPEIGDKQH